MHFSVADHPGLKPPGFRHGLYNTLVVPRPIGWVSTISSDGVVNLAPYSFFNLCAGDPPVCMYCANGTHREGGPKDSLANVRDVPEFVFNLATVPLSEQMNATSASSPRSVDEMQEAGLDAAPSVQVRPPGVAASPIRLECVVHDIITLPSTETTLNTMVLGRVVEVHVADDVVVDGMVDWQRLQPLSRLGYMDYATLGEVFAMNRPA